jgi:hypothetical protein
MIFLRQPSDKISSLSFLQQVSYWVHVNWRCIREVMDVQSVKVELFFCVIIDIKFFRPPAEAHSDPLLVNSP